MRLEALPLEREDGVDEVLERLRPGERAVLRDVARRGSPASRPSWRGPRGAPPRRAPARRSPASTGGPDEATVWIESTTRAVQAAPPRPPRGSCPPRSRRGGEEPVRRRPRDGRPGGAPAAPTPRPRRRGPRPAVAASRAATWRRSVDFPIPGSPPRRTTEPGTRPPPRTRSTSASPVRRRGASAASTSRMRRTGALPAGRDPLARPRGPLRLPLDERVPAAALGAAAEPARALRVAGRAGEDAARAPRHQLQERARGREERLDVLVLPAESRADEERAPAGLRMSSTPARTKTAPLGLPLAEELHLRVARSSGRSPRPPP